MRLPLRVIDYVKSSICEERSNLGGGFELGVVQLSVVQLGVAPLMSSLRRGVG
jgi:hypothetical protein